MSDTGSNGDNKPQQDEVNLESSDTVANLENKPVTPVKKTPSKRLSAVERAQRESEQLVKTLGGSLDIEGGRKTRSSTRGTPTRASVVDTPPPAKKSRASSGTPKRGRARKLEAALEEEAKTSPEKTPSEPELIKEEEKSAVDAAKSEDKIEEIKSDEVTSPAVEEKKSPAKQDEKPEPMEVDGVANKDIDSNSIESENKIESTQDKIESSDKKIEENSKANEDVIAEQQESSSAIEETKILAPISEEKVSEVEKKIPENIIGNNVDANESEANLNSLPAGECLATPLPGPQESVAGNEHKDENNDLCEPKIVSPPITANNEGATPQYCN